MGSASAPVTFALAFEAATADASRAIVAVNGLPGAGHAGTRVKVTRAKPMILGGPAAISEKTGPNCAASDVAPTHVIADGANGSGLPTVLIAAGLGTNRPTRPPVGHVAVPAPVRVMSPVMGLTLTVTVTGAPIGA